MNLVKFKQLLNGILQFSKTINILSSQLIPLSQWIYQNDKEVQIMGRKGLARTYTPYTEVKSPDT